MMEALSMWGFVVQVASVLAGIAGPWLLYQHRQRKAVIDRLIEQTGIIDGSLEAHKRDDRRHFKRINKILKRLSKRSEIVFTPDTASKS